MFETDGVFMPVVPDILKKKLSQSVEMKKPIEDKPRSENHIEVRGTWQNSQHIIWEKQKKYRIKLNEINKEAFENEKKNYWNLKTEKIFGVFTNHRYIGKAMTESRKQVEIYPLLKS